MSLSQIFNRRAQVFEMNILLSAYACRPNAGSEPGTGWNWAFHLALAGCEVYLFTAGRNRDSITAYLKENPCPRLHPQYIDVPWMNPMGSGAKHYLLWQWITLRKAKALARQISFDVVHHVSYGSVHFPTQLWRLGVPTVFGPVGGGQTTPESLLPYFGKDEKSERKRTLITNLLPKIWVYKSWMKRMSVVLATNNDTRALAENVGCSRVQLLCDTGSRNDFCSEAPRTFDDTSKVRLLWVGRFLPRKGLPLALDALAHTRPEVHLTLVGDGLSPETVERMITERALTGRVHWAGGRLPWLQVREAYTSHDALLFTSLRDSFGSQNLEAMSVGLPVITLNLSGARDLIPDETALKVAVGASVHETVRNLSEAMDRFAAMSLELRNRMSKFAWQHAADFSWTARAVFAKKLYAELLNDQRVA
jgi:glycosyltransferase involved in cell wall biosynthesis